MTAAPERLPLTCEQRAVLAAEAGGRGRSAQPMDPARRFLNYVQGSGRRAVMTPAQYRRWQSRLRAVNWAARP